MTEIPERMMGPSTREAEQIAADKQKTATLLDEAMRKAAQQEGRLKQVWGELQMLFRFARAWARGAYRGVPWKTIVLVLAAIIYFVNPLDLIPDALLALGYLDDATVIAWVLRSVKRDVDRFREWETAQQTPLRS